MAGGDSQTEVSRQVELANGIVKAISALSPDAAAPAESIAEPARNLLAIAESAGTPGRRDAGTSQVPRPTRGPDVDQRSLGQQSRPATHRP